MDYAIGIDLGGSSVKAVAISFSGEIIERVNEDFDVDQQFDFAKKIRRSFSGSRKSKGARPSVSDWPRPDGRA
jgi:predicted NBD/HSP70 family sugar kinase